MQQKEAILAENIVAIVAALPFDLRDQALITLVYAGGLRRSENQARKLAPAAAMSARGGKMGNSIGITTGGRIAFDEVQRIAPRWSAQRKHTPEPAFDIHLEGKETAMRITIGGYIAFDDDQSILGVGASPAAAIDAIQEADKDLAPFSTLPASEALIAKFEQTGVGGPTWLTVSTHLGEVACLEEEDRED